MDKRTFKRRVNAIVRAYAGMSPDYERLMDSAVMDFTQEQWVELNETLGQARGIIMDDVRTGGAILHTAREESRTKAVSPSGLVEFNGISFFPDNMHTRLLARIEVLETVRNRLMAERLTLLAAARGYVDNPTQEGWDRLVVYVRHEDKEADNGVS